MVSIPNNIADTAAAIKNGDIGLIPVVKIGDITVTALTGLSAPHSVEITRKPVQAGYDITDAAIKQPNELTLNIVLANPEFSVSAGIDAALTGNFSGFTETWRDKRDRLKQLLDIHELVTVQTHEDTYNNMLVRMIDPIFDVDNNADAYVATVYCTEIQFGDEETGGVIDQPLQSVGGL